MRGEYPEELFKQFNVYRAQDLVDADSVAYLTGRLMEDVQKRIAVLPRVGPQGQSDCPFAEKLFYQLAVAQKKLEEHLARMRRTRDELRSSREKLEHLARVIGEDSEDAGSRWLEKARHYEEHAQTLSKAIGEGQSTLQIASQHEWPLGPPRGDFGRTA